MSLRINSNLASLTAQRYLEKTQRQVDDSFKALASGSRLSTPQNDAAGFAISELLRAQVAGLDQSAHNVKTAQAFVQTAEGSLNEQNNILVRMRELAVNAASDTVGDNERGYVNDEFQQLLSEFDRIAKATSFGSNHLLNGSGKELEFQVGPYKGDENVIRYKLDANTTASNVGISGLDVTDKGDAKSALESIDEAVQKVAATRASLGGIASRFNYTNDALEAQKENIDEARSVIADVDVAEETSKLARGQVLQESGMAVLAQANSYPQKFLKLID